MIKPVPVHPYDLHLPSTPLRYVPHPNPPLPTVTTLPPPRSEWNEREVDGVLGGKPGDGYEWYPHIPLVRPQAYSCSTRPG